MSGCSRRRDAGRREGGVLEGGKTRGSIRYISCRVSGRHRAWWYMGGGMLVACGEAIWCFNSPHTRPKAPTQ